MANIGANHNVSGIRCYRCKNVHNTEWVKPLLRIFIICFFCLDDLLLVKHVSGNDVKNRTFFATQLYISVHYYVILSPFIFPKIQIHIMTLKAYLDKRCESCIEGIHG